MMPLTGVLTVSWPLVCGCSRVRVGTHTLALTQNLNVMVIRGFVSVVRNSMRVNTDVYASTPQVSEFQVFSRHMSTSGKPPDMLEDRPKPGSTEINPSNGKFEKLLDYVQEKSPEVYTLGQKLSEKSSSFVNSLASRVNKTPQVGEKPEDWNDILNRWYIQYQDFIGITDLKKAQDRVTELSETLLETQGQRRALQAETEDLQERLSTNHQRITKTEQYSQEHFTLFDEARTMSERLKVVRGDFAVCERTERDTFTQLSAAIRDCHERERMQAEQSKYWSIIASVVSAALASIITSVNNWVRIREIKDHVSSTNQLLIEGYEQMHQDVLGAMSSGSASGVQETGVEMDNAEKVVLRATKVPDSEKGAVGVSNVAVNASLQNQSEKETRDSSGSTSVAQEDRASASPGPLKATLPQEEVPRLAEELSCSLWQQMSAVLAQERERLREQVDSKMENAVSRMAAEGDRVRVELGMLRKEILALSTQKVHKVTPDLEMKTAAADVTLETAKALGSAILLSTKEEQPTVAVSEYSYRHIASAMAVGAGIGTLATAFILRSFAGSAGV